MKIVSLVCVTMVAFAQQECGADSTNITYNINQNTNHTGILPPDYEDVSTLNFSLERASLKGIFLPWQDRMSFESARFCLDEGRDLFSLKIISFRNSRHFFLWYVDSQYPLTLVGPRMAILSTGLSLSFRFR